MGSSAHIKRGRSKIAPPLRSLSLAQRKLLNQAEELISVKYERRTVEVYLRHIRTFIKSNHKISTLIEQNNFFINNEHFIIYCSYLKDNEIDVYSFLSQILNALKAAFPGTFDEQGLRDLRRQYKKMSHTQAKDAVTFELASLSDHEKSFVEYIKNRFGFHRSDQYLRFLGHLARFSSDILDIDYAKRFLQPTFEPILRAWLATVLNAGSLQGFHLVGEALNARLASDAYDWIKPAILSHVRALTARPTSAKISDKPEIASTSVVPGSSIPLKTATDMRISPLLDLMETIAPTRHSPIRPSRRFRAIREASRKTLDHDILHLINARIVKGIGSPEDPATEIFSLPSLMALTEYFEKKELDPRTMGRMLGRIRWLRRRLLPLDDDHGSLYLSIIGRHHFLSKPPKRRNVSHINYLGLNARLQAFLVEVERGIRDGIGLHSLRWVEWRDLLIVGVMLTTGIRLKNAHELRSHWLQLAPSPCLCIPAGCMKNGDPFFSALPNWLVASLCAYAPDLGNRAKPDFPVWRSRNTSSLSRISVQRSIQKTSLCLVQEPLQPHDYRRLRCIFVQDSDDIDQSQAHLATGHRELATLYGIYGSTSIPDYVDDVFAPFRDSTLDTGSRG